MLAKNDSIVKEVKFLETNRHDGTAYYDSVNQVWYYSKNLELATTRNVSRFTWIGGKYALQCKK